LLPLLRGRLMGSLALYMRPLLPPLLLLPLPLPLLLPLAGVLLRHLLPMAVPLLLLLVVLRAPGVVSLSASAAAKSSSVSMAAKGLPLLLLLVLLLLPVLPCWLAPVLLPVLPLPSLLHALPAVLSKSSRVRMNHGGSFEVDLLSDRHAVSFSSCTARLTSSCLRLACCCCCCCGRFGGKFCIMLLLLLGGDRRWPGAWLASAGCAGRGMPLLLSELLLLDDCTGAAAASEAFAPLLGCAWL
jgi:hypothetical protein